MIMGFPRYSAAIYLSAVNTYSFSVLFSFHTRSCMKQLCMEDKNLPSGVCISKFHGPYIP